MMASIRIVTDVKTHAAKATVTIAVFGLLNNSPFFLSPLSWTRAEQAVIGRFCRKTNHRNDCASETESND